MLTCGVEYTIPIGFVSDGCSCPKFLWGYCNALDALFFEAYLIHDWFYTNHLVTKEEADELLYNMLLHNGMSRMKAFTIWKAVSMFGGSHWN